MTKKGNPGATRRGLLIGAAVLGGAPVLAGAGAASAAGTLPKTNAKYQDHPNGKQRCGLCNYFIPGATPMCKVVAGPISPTGWCVLFAAKAA